jgi:hypothetical protein
MKNKSIGFKLIFGFVLSFAFFACDKITNPYKPSSAVNTVGSAAYDSSSLNHSLYPGPWSQYVATKWPTFSANTNTNRNVLIEDFTGHKCPNCPIAATTAEQIEAANPGRVFVAAIHAGPSATGITNFQETDAYFTQDFTNPQGLAYGIFFKDGYGFAGNPRGPINRTVFGTDYMFTSPTSWTANTSSMLNDNVLKVNIQAKVNYFDTTRGMFLHVEVEALQDLPATARCVVYFVEDQVIGPQKDGPIIDSNYHFNNIHRGNIDGQVWGQALLPDNAALTTGQKALLYYSYQIPQQYDPSKCHLLIYISDDNTKEIFQVIKQTIL